MTQAVTESLATMFKRALCDCLCTDIDLDLDNAQNNSIVINVTPIKQNSSENSSETDIKEIQEGQTV